MGIKESTKLADVVKQSKQKQQQYTTASVREDDEHHFHSCISHFSVCSLHDVGVEIIQGLA